MSAIRNRQRSRANEYFAYFADPYGFRRTIALYLWDALLELRAARRQRKRGEEHIDRGGMYPLMRGAITVIMRDLNVATLLGDIVERASGQSYWEFLRTRVFAPAGMHATGSSEPRAVSGSFAWDPRPNT